MSKLHVTLDGNKAAAHVAYRTNEVIAIYPITPSSPMGEWADQWQVEGAQNLWGSTPVVQEMQSEGGAAGAVHGALQTGSLTTTFTASQGLLLMIPNMYKIAGELTPTVFHIAARSLAAQALSIFGDHSDVMATRGTGWGMLFANSVQEVHDFALIAQAASLEARVPFLHIFDGFRTSHEVAKIELLPDSVIRSMIDDELVRAHRRRALNPDNPFIRGTAQNPDTFFQARESVNPYYAAVPGIVSKVMRRFDDLTGRTYGLVEYVGAPDADRAMVIMGSGAETVEETVKHLNEHGNRVGVLKVRLFRPFPSEHLLAALPESVTSIAVLDRTKEPGSAGEPLYQDVVTTVAEAAGDGRPSPRVIGGRFGLSSKEFTPAMAAAVFHELATERPRNHFTVGIDDDVTGTSLDYDRSLDIEPDDVLRAVFWGLGSDGTVGANKNSVKIIGEGTDLFAQGYFVYDSRKAGARTISHLRFGPRPIRSSYLIKSASFVACHQFDFLERYDVLATAAPHAVFLLNSPYPAEDVWDRLPREVQGEVLDKQLDLWVIDAHSVAREVGLEGRINTVMQTCFFALSDLLPHQAAADAIRSSIRSTYGKRGEQIVRQNLAAVDQALERLERVNVPKKTGAALTGAARSAPVSDRAPEFVRTVTAALLAGEGDELPVSAFPADGTYPSATTRWEKRNLALEVPIWDEDLCIQCGKCVLVCPHAVIRSKLVPNDALAGAPEGFKHANATWRELPDHQYALQVSVEDCTGCELCVDVCPAMDRLGDGHRALEMVDQRPLRESGTQEWDYFLGLPDVSRSDGLRFNTVRNVQLLEPLFEFSSACSGCGETPYIKLLTQLFGDRAFVANATGCSSIYGGNMPTTPWSKSSEGRGPAWSNSLFEDNAEFGLGMRITQDKQREYAKELLVALRGDLDTALVDELLAAAPTDDAGIQAQRDRITTLVEALDERDDARSRDLAAVAGALVPKSVWLVGGDGWAYDIGYGGLDHVLASGRDLNVLVLDTEVYSNTGGQASKATPLAAVARFAAGGKPTGKKDLGRMAMVYGNVYVAQVAMGASDAQLIRAFIEAESFPGPSLIIAYGHCIAHGIDMSKGLQQQKLAVDAGYWPLYRFDPRRAEDGLNPFQLDSKPPSIPLKDYAYNENRYRVLARTDPDAASALLESAQAAVDERWSIYAAMAGQESGR